MNKNILKFSGLRKNKKGQEEMVGFGLIIIIVAVILLVLLSLSMSGRDKEIINSYEISSFLTSMSWYTTECKTHLELQPVSKLISDCYQNKMCLDEKSACDILNSTIKNILDASWSAGENFAVKGYRLRMSSGDEESFLIFEEGNVTSSIKTGYIPATNNIDIHFSVYY